MMKVMKVTDMQALGYFSLQVRKEKQKTLQDLADLTQFSKSQLSNFETGKVVNPSLLFIEKLRSVYKELHADHETGAADNK